MRSKRVIDAKASDQFLSVWYGEEAGEDGSDADEMERMHEWSVTRIGEG